MADVELIDGPQAPPPPPEAASASGEESPPAGGDAPSGAPASGAPTDADATQTKPVKAKELAALARAQARARIAQREAKRLGAERDAQLAQERQRADALARELTEAKAWRQAKEKEPVDLSRLDPEKATEAIRGYVKDSDPAVVAQRAVELARAAHERAENAEKLLQQKVEEYDAGTRKIREQQLAAAAESQIQGFVRAVRAEAKTYPYLVTEYDHDEIVAETRKIQATCSAKGVVYPFSDVASYLDRQAKARYDRRAEREAALSPPEGGEPESPTEKKNGQGRESRPGNGRRDKPGQKTSTPAETDEQREARLREVFRKAWNTDHGKR